MRAVRLKAVLEDDHRLQIEVPEEIAVGPVEVIVLSEQPAARRPEQGLDALFADIDQMPCSQQTREEVDRALAEERASWE
ncbi:MAG: hypothetical protein GVY22_04085 [Gammaproteobacteria bacterium]|jgi:hypothetical protein|nr:hypothetical protein [Gammaproteobacteria bacterium]